MKDPHDIILRPVLTEKAYEGIGDKRYIFEVAIDANKTEIKLALESIFAEDGVKVFEGMAQTRREDKEPWLFDSISRLRPPGALCRC